MCLFVFMLHSSTGWYLEYVFYVARCNNSYGFYKTIHLLDALDFKCFYFM